MIDLTRLEGRFPAINKAIIKFLEKHGVHTEPVYTGSFALGLQESAPGVRITSSVNDLDVLIDDDLFKVFRMSLKLTEEEAVRPPAADIYNLESTNELVSALIPFSYNGSKTQIKVDFMNMKFERTIHKQWWNNVLIKICDSTHIIDAKKRFIQKYINIIHDGGVWDEFMENTFNKHIQHIQQYNNVRYKQEEAKIRESWPF